MQLVAPVSGDLVVKLALGAAAIGGLWYAWRQLPSVGEAAKAAGNATVNTGTGALESAAKGVGGGLVATVDALGMTDYLKRISTPQTEPPAPEIAPGTVVIDGQTFNFGY